MRSSEERIPKKKFKESKYCQLCKSHGGAHTTHNTLECRKYEKDGTLKGGATKSSAHGKHHKNNFAQLLERCEKLERKLSKASKSVSRKKKRSYSSDSSDDSD